MLAGRWAPLASDTGFVDRVLGGAAGSPGLFWWPGCFRHPGAQWLRRQLLRTIGRGAVGLTWPWQHAWGSGPLASHLPSLSLSFHICKVGGGEGVVLVCTLQKDGEESIV